MDFADKGSPWREMEDVHEEIGRVRRWLLRLENRVARIEAGIEIRELDAGTADPGTERPPGRRRALRDVDE